MNSRLDWHLFDKHPKRILSLDGGGVRGLITLGLLKRVEEILAARSSDPAAFRLCDYFDLIGGASTGALISTMLAMGLRVDRIIEIDFDMIPLIFHAPNLTAGYYTKFDSARFKKALDETFEQLLAKELGRPDLLARENPHFEPRLGSDVLQTGLAIIAKRIDTSSVWVLTNNPRAKYFHPESPYWQGMPLARRQNFHPNSEYSLRDVVRASASAPYYLEAVPIVIDEKTTGLFLDGGVTPHNNPAAELFLHTTLRAHGEDQQPPPTGFGWETGADNLFILSLGVGQWDERHDPEEFMKASAAWQGMTAMFSIIGDGMQSGLTWLQAISEPAAPACIDGNLGDMAGLRIAPEPLLTFQRINPVLELAWLHDNLGPHLALDAEMLKTMRDIDVPDLSNLNRCYEIGLESGRKLIKPALFSKRFAKTLRPATANRTESPT